MKPHVLLFLASLLTVSWISQAQAQGSAFTYQGHLTDNGEPAQGLFDFEFRLTSDPLEPSYVGSALQTNGVSVVNGGFTVELDFGSGVFDGADLWLEIGVRTNGGAEYVVLEPRQALKPTPYAIFAGGSSNLLGLLPSTALAGEYDNAVHFQNAANTFQGSFGGDGSLLSNVNAVALSGLPAGRFWQLGGNAGVSSNDFIGTLDPEPLELRTGGSRALRLEPGMGFPNVIGGSASNSVAPAVQGATIAGGDMHSITASWSGIVGGQSNRIGSAHAIIGAGAANAIEPGASHAFIGAGRLNSIGTNSSGSVIAGGTSNRIGVASAQAIIAGGISNSIDQNAFASGVYGGAGNAISAGSAYSTIGGGLQNRVLEDSSHATVAGGRFNRATADQAVVSGGGFNSALAHGATVSGGEENRVEGAWSSVAGGRDNRVGLDANDAVIGGGASNRAHDFVVGPTISGGTLNQVEPFADYSTIAGGSANAIEIGAAFASTAGGWSNRIGSDSPFSAIGGGFNNFVSGLYSVIAGGAQNTNLGSYSVIPGGELNQVAGFHSMAAGRQAQALHDGTFVWADQQEEPFASTGQNQFLIRASGGVGINTSDTELFSLAVNGDTRLNGLVWMGSETNTADVPDKPILIRRINSMLIAPGAVVARTDKLALERDGTDAGFRISYKANPGFTTIVAMGMRANGTQVNFVTFLDQASPAGTVTVFSNLQDVVYFRCIFGDPFTPGHQTEVSMMRYAGDAFWTGSMISTYNQ
ncbi:MAG TPA: hypothetical protein PLH97_05430 [Verrucomicrobiota bacterium]|nr:hypothetical protein [Verrucomicrobiota bacterium]HPU55704.1 hypothetical protein [Verrucomicrobiota bacterium]